MAADRERAAEVAREAEVAVNSTAEKHAADITARTSGGLRRGGWSRVAAVRARRRCSDGGAAWRRGVCCAALQLHGASSSGRSRYRRFGARTHASRCTSMLHTSRVVQVCAFFTWQGRRVGTSSRLGAPTPLEPSVPDGALVAASASAHRLRRSAAAHPARREQHRCRRPLGGDARHGAAE